MSSETGVVTVAAVKSAPLCVHGYNELAGEGPPPPEQGPVVRSGRPPVDYEGGGGIELPPPPPAHWGRATPTSTPAAPARLRFDRRYERGVPARPLGEGRNDPPRRSEEGVVPDVCEREQDREVVAGARFHEVHVEVVCPCDDLADNAPPKYHGEGKETRGSEGGKRLAARVLWEQEDTLRLHGLGMPLVRSDQEHVLRDDDFFSVPAGDKVPQQPALENAHGCSRFLVSPEVDCDDNG
mmetsp:Transcript_21590/g.63355  ORF Transcript_21590/g.63355 Transcript_21590/m.63355 type:complete len:239 (-) Transcript_21590:102-818(-)